MRRGRAAGGRGLLSPPARTVAPSSQGFAPPPGGLREALGCPASPILRHSVPRPPSGRPAQVRALRSSIASAAVPDRLLGSAVPPDCCCIPSGRPAAAAAAAVAPAAAAGSAAVASPHQRAPSGALPAPAPPQPEHPARAAALRPSRARQLCPRSAMGAGTGKGPSGSPGPDSRRRASEGREPRAAHSALGECLGSGDSPPLPPPLPPPAPSRAARAAPQGGSGLRGLLLCAATMVRSE